MSSENPTNQVESITIERLKGNLSRVGSRTFAAFQSLMDNSLFFLSSSMLANERDFQQLREGARFAPSEAHALSFERAKFEAERWLLRNNLQDGLRLILAVLEDMRTLCELIRHVDSGGEELKTLLARITGKDRAAFNKLPLSGRIAELGKRYGITMQHADCIVGLARALECMNLRGGVVGKEDAGDASHLEIPLLGLALERGAGEDSAAPEEDVKKALQMRLKSGVKRVPLGQAISFSKAEHLAVILSFCILTSKLLQEGDKCVSAGGMPEKQDA